MQRTYFLQPQCYYNQYYPDTFIKAPYLSKRNGQLNKYSPFPYADTNTRFILLNTRYLFIPGHPKPSDTVCYNFIFQKDSTNQRPGITNIYTSNLSLELTAPLVKGRQYHLNYILAIDSFLDNYPICRIGASETKSSFGDSIGTTSGHLRTFRWQKRDIIFTAPNNSRYITLELVYKYSNFPPGTYNPQLGFTSWHTYYQWYFDNFEMLCETTIENDTLLCSEDSFTLHTTGKLGSFLWNTGDTSNSLTVKTKGKYFVTVDEAGCISSDTATIDFKNIKKDFLGADTLLCNAGGLKLQPGIIGLYNWSNGSNATDITITSSGTYSVSITDGPCIFNDTIDINIEFKKTPDFKTSWTVCKDSTIQIVSKRPSPSWLQNNGVLLKKGDTLSYKATIPEKIYSISGNLCIFVDTVYIKTEYCGSIAEDTLYIPNAFSPNDDGINDIFSISGLHNSSLQLIIFNRWGEILLVNEGTTVKWDGKYKDKTCQQDIYYYYLKVSSNDKDKFINRFYKGQVTLLH